MLYDASDKVVGISTKDMGISKDGSKKETFQPGVDIKGHFLSFSFSSSSISSLLLLSYVFAIHRTSDTIWRRMQRIIV